MIDRADRPIYQYNIKPVLLLATKLHLLYDSIMHRATDSSTQRTSDRGTCDGRASRERCVRSQGKHVEPKVNVQGMLRDAGLRSTREREAALSYMVNAHGPHAVEEVFEGMCRAVNKVTLYRTLERFADAGLVERIQTNDRARHYEFQHEHHHHLTCTHCGFRARLSVPENRNFPTIDAAAHAFKAVTSHTLEFFGVCLKCAIQNRPRS